MPKLYISFNFSMSPYILTYGCFTDLRLIDFLRLGGVVVMAPSVYLLSELFGKDLFRG